MRFNLGDGVFYSKWERIFFAIGAGIVLTGIILKYNGYHVSWYFLIVGIVIALTSYFIGFFSNDEDQDDNGNDLDLIDR
ncbi:MAG: hypothetical protein AB8B56_01275 [Crocinitomicaceae bacterium]